MLVVTRKVGERIVIGDNVTLTVVRIAGGMVRLGVEAPAACVVVRKELLDAQTPATDRPESPHANSPHANPPASDRSPD